jgi:hypothetical protein
VNQKHRAIATPEKSPASRPLRSAAPPILAGTFERALAARDGQMGAHCIHEMWMRGDFSINVDAAINRLWERAADSIPDWLPMRHIEWLPAVYDVAARFQAPRGRANIYLVLLDYRDSRDEPFGIYVGMSRYSPAQRFDQHKAGIRASGSVLRRGLEVLAGPTQHLQRIARGEAAQIEVALAEALTATGLFVQGGH